MSGNAGAAAPRNGLAAGRTVKSAGNRQNIVERASGGGKSQGIVVDPRRRAHRGIQTAQGPGRLALAALVAALAVGAFMAY